MYWRMKKLIFIFSCCLIFLTLYLSKIYNKYYFTRYFSIEENPFYAKYRSINFSKNLSWIDQNPIYAKYKIPTAKRFKRVTVVIIVSTAPSRSDRRQAIRDTFWKECIPIRSIVPECLFITDHLEPNQRYYNETQAELKKYGDLKFQKLTKGVNLGERLIYHMLYAMKNYEFDYFVRMDDDYFLCLNNLLQELPTPMQRYLHWGWCHHTEHVMRPDEAMLLLSKDVIGMFLNQDLNKMKCHVSADQMLATWTMEINFRNFFRHDSRLHHTPLVSLQPELLKLENVCSTYMGLHGSFPQEMRTLYSHRGPAIETTKTILDHSVVMSSYDYGVFDWTRFIESWNYEPKLCITNPTWDTSLLLGKNGEYGGRARFSENKV